MRESSRRRTRHIYRKMRGCCQVCDRVSSMFNRRVQFKVLCKQETQPRQLVAYFRVEQSRLGPASPRPRDVPSSAPRRWVPPSAPRTACEEVQPPLRLPSSGFPELELLRKSTWVYPRPKASSPQIIPNCPPLFPRREVARDDKLYLTQTPDSRLK